MPENSSLPGSRWLVIPRLIPRLAIHSPMQVTRSHQGIGFYHLEDLAPMQVSRQHESLSRRNPWAFAEAVTAAG
jgi:hypothetical protein